MNEFAPAYGAHEAIRRCLNGDPWRCQSNVFEGMPFCPHDGKEAFQPADGESHVFSLCEAHMREYKKRQPRIRSWIILKASV